MYVAGSDKEGSLVSILALCTVADNGMGLVVPVKGIFAD